MYEWYVYGNLYGNLRFVFVIVSLVVIDRNLCNFWVIFILNEGNGFG